MRRTLLIAPLLVLSFPAERAHAQDREARNREIYLYRGADREERLVAGARREGGLTLHSTMTLEDAGPLIAGFEKKYGVKVTMWRGTNQKLVQRAVAEARAGNAAVDAFEGSGHHARALPAEAGGRSLGHAARVPRRRVLGPLAGRS
jgi:iron(III) transport system substrate-binding protein